MYTITWTGKFTAGKTMAVASAYKSGICYPVYTSADVITLQFQDVATPTAQDSGDFDLDIIVYD